MLKLTLSLLLVAAAFAATPALAEAKGSGIDRGCTLNPFTHTMRCIDFDHCTKNSKGEQICPVVVTSTSKAQ